MKIQPEFRALRKSLQKEETGCAFCSPLHESKENCVFTVPEKVVLSDEHWALCPYCRESEFCMALLEVENLYKEFYKDKRKFAAVDHIHFSIREGECLGLVGESGCGKSTTAFLNCRIIKTG